MTCPACGVPMSPRPGWTTCLTCRRAGRVPPLTGFQPEWRTCGRPSCGREFLADRSSHLYCRPEHRPGRQRQSTEDRGYGAEHKALRKRWRPKVQAGHVDCHAVLCLMAEKRGRRIRPGEKWDLGHTPDRTAWTGPEHRHCNRSEGARRKQAMAREERRRG